MRRLVDLPQPDGPDQHEELAVGDLEVERVDGRPIRTRVDCRVAWS